MKKTYKIPIIYQSVETFEVEAENLQDAVTIALKEFMKIPDDKYIDDSFEIDSIIHENYSDETYNIDQVINEI